VFFLTASSDVIDKVKGFETGAVDYITKPLHPEEVLARVHAHLELRELQLALEARNEELDREIQQRVAAERALKHSLESAVLVTDEHGVVRLPTGTAERICAHQSLARDAQLLPAIVTWLRDPRARAVPLRIARGGRDSAGTRA
jgi:DNA-binding response OmpR family regulator